MNKKNFGHLTFDTIRDSNDTDHIDGCYRINGGEWMIFYFTHITDGDGARWEGDPIIRMNVIWPSGAKGMDAVLPINITLNNTTVSRFLSALLEVEEWTEVSGPDSLQMK